MKVPKVVFIIFIACVVLLLCQPALAQSEVTLQSVDKGVQTAITGVNFVWVLVCGFMVMLMQLGFAMLEGGLTRAKNNANIMMKNLMDFCAGSLAYWAVGFALMMGTSTGVMQLLAGTNGFFLLGDTYSSPDMIKMWFWQMVFCATAATIVSGAMAERTKFSTYVIASIVISALIYPIYGHWVWGGGWIATSDFMVNLANNGNGYGAMDFAGSGVVHAVGGFVALAGAWLVGARIGKYGPDGKVNAIPGHSISMAMFGVFILWFGWFGFNPGSTLAGTDTRIALIAVNTTIAAAAGAMSAMFITWYLYKKPDVGMTGNGVVAGLVAITASCAFVSPAASVVIGLVAGGLVIASVWFVDNKLKVDDPVGAISVHAANGVFGLLALGLFADGTYMQVTGLLFGNAGFFLAQAISAIVVALWAFGAGAVMFYILKKTIGLRVKPEEELEGLDLSEHGMVAYPNFVTTDGAFGIGGSSVNKAKTEEEPLTVKPQTGKGV